MNLRPLGATGLHVSPIGFGCFQLGGEGWGTYSLRDTQRAVRRAVELGVRLFDTAPVYGFGRSEELLAGSLGRDRQSVVIVSKAGLVWDAQKRVKHDNRPESLRSQLEGSLRRLRREALDVLLLHWPDPAVVLAESIAALDSFREAGLIRAWGLSNFPAEDVAGLGRESLVLEYPWNAIQSYAAESIGPAEAGKKLLEARRPGWGFIAYDVLARGLLGGRYSGQERFGKRDIRARDARFAPPSLAGSLEAARSFPAGPGSPHLSPAAEAVRAVLATPGVTACLVGIKHPAQIEECAAAAANVT